MRGVKVMKTAVFLNKDRPVAQVPRWVKAGLILALVLQIVWHLMRPPVSAHAERLPLPLPAGSYQLMTLNEPIAMAKYLNLWLQSFDNQPGISLSFRQLDYHRVIQWLETILKLDPRDQYPMLVAAHIYGSIHNARKQRIMMDYIFKKFNQHPARYWRWLAHAVIVARHELNDKALALKYADALTKAAQSRTVQVPYWARDLKIIVLEDMGELEAAKVLVGGLIANGKIHDPYEKRFLVQKIKILEQKVTKARQDVEISTDKTR